MSRKRIVIALVAALACAFSVQAQRHFVATLEDFKVTPGSKPYSTMTLGRDGNLYGTTSGGGSNFNGTIFELSSNNTVQTLAQFMGHDGSFPVSKMVQASNSNFFGITYVGGANGVGSIFGFNPSNNLITSLYSFNGTGGAFPWGGLTLASNGMLYGTTSSGGPAYSNFAGGNGTIFQITQDGAFNSEYAFLGGTDGAIPYGAMVQGTDGALYGTTFNGGNNNCGTIFKWSPTLGENVILRFTDDNGVAPGAGLSLGRDGYFYGTTSSGGQFGQGTVFRTSDMGELTTIHNFNGNDGATPYSPLECCDNCYYGTTYLGGLNTNGTIYRFGPITNPVPRFESFYSFHNLTDGAYPEAGLTFRHGNLYGATIESLGGVGPGTIFEYMHLPRLEKLSFLNNQISFLIQDAYPQVTYQTQYSYTLEPGSWTSWGLPIHPTGRSFNYSENVSGISSGFIRVEATIPWPISH